MSMLHLETKSSETFTAKGGETFCYSEIFGAVKNSIEFSGKSNDDFLSPEDLEDAFQDAALKVLRYSFSYDPQKAKPTTWAATIAANCKTDTFAKRMREKVTFTPLVVVDHATSGSFATDFEAETNEGLARIYGAIDSLQESYRDILRLKLNGEKPAKMAERLGCTPAEASLRLFRAKKALKRALGAKYLSDNGIE